MSIADAEICFCCFEKFEEYDSLCSQAAQVQDIIATSFKFFQAKLQNDFVEDIKEKDPNNFEVDNLFDFVEYTEETAEESEESEGPIIKKTETINYTCNSCQEKFHKKKDYQAHLRSAHLPIDAELFACSQCINVCISEMDLKLHIAVSHNKDEKFKCPICNKLLSSRNLLVRHFGIHSSSTSRPHVCKFNQVSSLT